MLHDLKAQIQEELGHELDRILKVMCAHHGKKGPEPLPADWQATFLPGLGDAVNEAYRLHLDTPKKMLREFVWVGRRNLLGDGERDMLKHISPEFLVEFLTDMVHECGATSCKWLDSCVWVPQYKK